MENDNVPLTKFAVRMSLSFPIHAADLADAVRRVTEDLPHGTIVQDINVRQWRETVRPDATPLAVPFKAKPKKRKWLDSEDIMVQRVGLDCTAEQMADQLNRTPASVRSRLSLLRKNRIGLESDHEGNMIEHDL